MYNIKRMLIKEDCNRCSLIGGSSMIKKYGEHTIKQRENTVEIYTDPRMVLRVKKANKDSRQITIELHSSLNGRLSYDLPPALLKKVLSEIE